jgi:hypothetical protein
LGQGGVDDADKAAPFVVCAAARHSAGSLGVFTTNLDMLKLVYCLVPLVLAGCCAPMECRPAREGFVSYQPVIDVLAKYRDEKGAFPLSLESLTPNYLAKIPAPVRNSDGLKYTSDGATYELKFSYGGPGNNICTYRSMQDRWDCFGYY